VIVGHVCFGSFFSPSFLLALTPLGLSKAPFHVTCIEMRSEKILKLKKDIDQQ
jgi:hypothetical protein